MHKYLKLVLRKYLGIQLPTEQDDYMLLDEQYPRVKCTVGDRVYKARYHGDKIIVCHDASVIAQYQEVPEFNTYVREW